MEAMAGLLYVAVLDRPPGFTLFELRNLMISEQAIGDQLNDRVAGRGVNF